MNIVEEVFDFYDNCKCEKGFIGKTGLGVNIPYIKVYKTPNPIIIIQYTIHAREYITSYLALEQIKDYIEKGKKGTVYFIPMVNIDGVNICINGNPLYKANAFMVDLNVNFDALWGSGKQNRFYPSSENYVGKFPFSESESRALRDFTLKVKPNLTLSYHCKGEEIYWKFFQPQTNLERDYKIANEIANCTGYVLKETPYSAGGYKDWCIKKLRIPSFTIEVGEDYLFHPIDKKYLPQIYKKNERVVETLTEIKWI